MASPNISAPKKKKDRSSRGDSSRIRRKTPHQNAPPPVENYGVPMQYVPYGRSGEVPHAFPGAPAQFGRPMETRVFLQAVSGDDGFAEEEHEDYLNAARVYGFYGADEDPDAIIDPTGLDGPSALGPHSGFGEGGSRSQVSSARTVALMRYRRNHQLVQEIFTPVAVPDYRSVVNAQRLQMLRRQVSSLQSHQSKLEQELSTLVDRHEQRKRRYADSFAALREQLEQQRRLEHPSPSPTVAPTSTAVSSSTTSTSSSSITTSSTATPATLQSEVKSDSVQLTSTAPSVTIKCDTTSSASTRCEAFAAPAAAAPAPAPANATY